MIAMILLGASIFGYFFTLTQVTQNLVAFVGGLHVPPWVVLTLILFGYIVLGSFMDQIAILVLTVPIVLPSIKSLGSRSRSGSASSDRHRGGRHDHAAGRIELLRGGALLRSSGQRSVPRRISALRGPSDCDRVLVIWPQIILSLPSEWVTDKTPSGETS